MQYLSDEWIEAADRALATAWGSGGAAGDDGSVRAGGGGGDGDGDGDGVIPSAGAGEDQPPEDCPDAGRTTIGYTVTAAPQGKVTYHLFAGNDGAGVAAGKPEGDADATMELDYDTAVQIVKAETSPQVAFMQGRLKLGGDVTLLIKGAERLSAISDALATIDDVEY